MFTILFNHFHIGLDCRFKGIPNFIATDEGNSVGPKKEPSSLAECIEYCQETPGCFSFVYSESLKTCWPKDKMLLGKPLAKDGHTFFYRSCDMGNNDKYKLSIHYDIV